MKRKGIITLRKSRGIIFFLLVVTFLMSSCEERGYDGRDGRAYLALAYSMDEPDYIDAGTASVPRHFYWDEYYRSAPGYYTMYYDGIFYDGISVTEYAWEVDYEVYIYEGEPGGIGYNGADAPDTYFSVECNPYGPYVYDENRKASLPMNVKLIKKTDKQIVIEKSKNQFGLRITYKKVAPREDNQVKKKG